MQSRGVLCLPASGHTEGAGGLHHKWVPVVMTVNELEGFLEFLAAEISHAGLKAAVQQVLDAQTIAGQEAG